MKIAAIDIGTNSIHMVIARATGGTGFEVVEREREVVQIGRGSFERGRLKADAIRRTVEALARFVDLARREQVDRVLCTATAAVRESRNGGEFVQAAQEVAGITPRIIPPEEEGRLIYLAIRSALQLDASPSLIVDIGGGSVQLVVGDRDRLIESHSAPIGALRLSETLIESDPPSRRDLQRMRREIRKQCRPALEAVVALAPGRAYGSSGSIHALAQLASFAERGEPLEQLNGFALSREALERLTRRLQKMSLAEREKLVGIDQKRAEIVLPGAMALRHVLDELELDEITISDFGVREGLVTDYLSSHAREISALTDVDDLRMRSVLQLLQKFQPEERHLRHARHVATLSLALFDGLKAEHQLGPEERDILNDAALLHDVGAIVGYDGHGDHSFYLIKSGNLRGRSATEVQRIALVARYHGKRRPRKRDPEFRVLGKPERRTIRWLSAMLRIAEGLDRSHYQLVRQLRVVRRRGSVFLRLEVRPGARLEVWATRRRTDLLAKLLGRPVRVTPRRALASAGRTGTSRVAVPRRAAEASGNGRAPASRDRERSSRPARGRVVSTRP